MPTTHQRHYRNRPEWLRFHAAFQLFNRWHHSIYLAHFVFQVQIQIIPSECWFSMQWRHVWLFRNASQVTSLKRAGMWKSTVHLCPAKCRIQRTMIQIFTLPWQTHMFRYNVSASAVLQRVSWGLDRHRGERQTDRWRWTTLHWDQPVASVMHSLDLRVNGHGTLTRRNFTACMSGPLLIALICHSCSIQTQPCSHAHHPQPVSPTSNDIYVHLW